MQTNQLDAHTFVGPQISIADMAKIAKLGVRTIVIARPESEEHGQPTVSDICAAADAHGINVHQISVTPGNITAEDVQAFDVATSDNPHPVLAYCRSGARATTLWALSAASRGQSRLRSTSLSTPTCHKRRLIHPPSRSLTYEPLSIGKVPPDP